MHRLIFASALVIATLGGDYDGDGGSDYLAGSDGRTVSISGERRSTGTGPDERSPSDSPDAPIGRPDQNHSGDDCMGREDDRCWSRPPAAPPATPGIPALTIRDLAQFAPAPVVPTAEPSNAGVAGMPTNVVAAASVEVQSGALFGVPLSVRFTPSGYDFHFGDGSSLSATTGGATWAALGQAPFTPTGTSHVYRNRGVHSVDVDVRYTAEIDLGGGWFPVEGEITTDGPPRDIRIFEARTALVAHTCIERPRAVGC